MDHGEDSSSSFTLTGESEKRKKARHREREILVRRGALAPLPVPFFSAPRDLSSHAHTAAPIAFRCLLPPAGLPPSAVSLLSCLVSASCERGGSCLPSLANLQLQRGDCSPSAGEEPHELSSSLCKIRQRRFRSFEMARFQEFEMRKDQSAGDGGVGHGDHLKNPLNSGVTDLAGEPKARKPYTISKRREKWTEDEHKLFLESLQLHGRAWRRIQEHIGSKTAVQIRSHAQKFFSKVTRESSGDGNGVAVAPQIRIPPPRPKRKSAHPYPRKLGNPYPVQDIKLN